MDTIIRCDKTLEFKVAGTNERFLIRRNFVGMVPDWVLEHWYFDAALDDATITFLHAGEPDPDPEPESEPGGGEGNNEDD